MREAIAGRDNILLWRPRDDRLRRSEIGPHCWDADIETSYPIRLENRWPERDAYSGEHWSSHTDELLHYESMTERLALMQLEYHFNRPDLPKIAACATQPMLIVRQGIKRYPDIMLRLADDQRLVVDVKRRKALTPDVLEQLAVTSGVCELVGWQHIVVVEPEPVVEFNLEKLSASRHPRHAPGQDLRQAILDLCQRPRPLGDVADAVSPTSRGAVIAHLHHLMWTRAIDPITLATPLEWDLPVVASTSRLEERCTGRSSGGSW